jgi:hypothetical protein
MSRNWEIARRGIRDWYATVERCRATLVNAREKLGEDLGGFAATDLLLDNHPELRDTREAQNALDYISGRRGRNARR